MTLVETHYKHIVRDDTGRPPIADTTMKVIELVEAQFAYGWSPEELCFQHLYRLLRRPHSALA